MAKKEDLRSRLLHFFSKSEASLKELQGRLETKEGDGPRSVGARGPQGGCGKGRRKKNHRKQSPPEGTCSKNASSEGSGPPNSTKSHKVHVLSYSEPDLWRNGLLRRFGSLTWRKRRSSHFELSEPPGGLVRDPWPLGRLQRPAVGSDVDMRNRPDVCPTGGQLGQQSGRSEGSSQPSEMDSFGSSPGPSASFDSLLCWGDGSSWGASSSHSNPSLCGQGVPEMKEEALRFPSVQEERSKTLESVSEWAENTPEDSFATGTSSPSVREELGSMGLWSYSTEPVSVGVNGAEEPLKATPSPCADQPLLTANSDPAVKPYGPKIRYEIMITMSKKEEKARAKGTGPAPSCAASCLLCRPAEESTLSLGAAEPEKTEERHHQEPARPAPRLSAREEFQNCKSPRGVGTSEACRPVLTSATGSRASLPWASETSLGEGEGRSKNHLRHSWDGTRAEETDAVTAAGSPANRSSEPSGISLVGGDKEVQPKDLSNFGRALFCPCHRMEKVTGGVCSSQSRPGGSSANTSFKWKKAPPEALTEDPKPSHGKVSHVIERSRARSDSPSRVSLLLEAWEKGLVGMEATESTSSDSLRSRSSDCTRCHLSSKESPTSLFPENGRTPLSLKHNQQSFSAEGSRPSFSPGGNRNSPGPASTRRSHSPAGPRRSLSPADNHSSPFQAESRTSRPSENGKQSPSPADTRSPSSTSSPGVIRHCASPADSKPPFSPEEAWRSHSPTKRHSPFQADFRQSLRSAETRGPLSPAATKRSGSLADAKSSMSSTVAWRSRSPQQRQELPPTGEHHNLTSQADMRHSSSLPDVKGQYSVADIRRIYSAADASSSSSPAGARSSPSLAMARSSSSPAVSRRSSFPDDVKCSSSPANVGCSFSPASVRHSSSAADVRRSSSPAGVQRSSSPAGVQRSSSPAGVRRSSSPADVRRSSSPAGAGRSSSPAGVGRSSFPGDSRHLFYPSEAKGPSSSVDGGRSRSRSPRRESQAHGPVFAQVYTPASKSKGLKGTEIQEMNGTNIAGSQAENGCSDAPDTGGSAELQGERLITSTDRSWGETVPPVALTNTGVEPQKENHSMNDANSSSSAGSVRDSQLHSDTVFRGQIENSLSRNAKTAASSASLGGNCPSNIPNAKLSLLSPLPQGLSSNTIAKSQTQWFGPKGNNMVVFRTEQQVIVPQAGTTTVYRAGREIVMSTSGSGSAKQAHMPNAAPFIQTVENQEIQNDHTNAVSPKERYAYLPDLCSCSRGGTQVEGHMTQSRSAGVGDPEKQRFMLAPSFIPSTDAITVGEKDAAFSSFQGDANLHRTPAFQDHYGLIAEKSSEGEKDMTDSAGHTSKGSEHQSNLSEMEVVNTSRSQRVLHATDASGDMGKLGTFGGSPETVPEEQTVLNDLAKDSLEGVQEPTGPFPEMSSSNHEPLSEKKGNGTLEEDHEEVVDMELFVDTLRNMESSERGKPLKLHQRPPRPSTFAKHTSLPPIDEDHLMSKSKIPLPSPPGQLLDLTKEARGAKVEDVGPVKEDMEEVENPYLSKEEKSEDNRQAKDAYPWDNSQFKTEEEIGSFLEKLKQDCADTRAKVIVPKTVANQSNLIRANILKGISLLSGFVDKKPPEDKPYSRLDNSLLYSRFINPQKSQIMEKGEEEMGSPMFLSPAIQKVNRESQVSPNGPRTKAFIHLSSELLSSQRHAEPPTKVPSTRSSSKQGFLAKQTDLSPQEEAQQEEKKPPTKINVRPGKIILYSESGFGGQKREIWGDITDATSWEFSPTISIRVIRGGWVMYEKPRFHGRKCVLAEGDVEITNPWRPYSKDGDTVENAPFHIGSLKRIVRDYRIPEISLFSEQNGEGTKKRFLDSSEDTRIHCQPLKASSIIVYSGLWLVYSKPYFDDDPYVLEPGGYPSLQAWGAKDPSICSLHPIKMGCPVVEVPGEPKALIYEKPHFQGHSWEVSRDIYNLKKPENNQDAKMATAGSMKILGGCWVGYEKEGFRGHQYLLEEGEYNDWTQWGGYNEELMSLRLIRTDFLDPALVLFEAMDFEDGPSVELSEALPDVELASYGTTTQSIHVLSGVWVAYEGKNFTGEQYILEKGVYRNCEDWGANDCQISSVQPILQVGEHSLHFVSQIQLFSDPDFSGNCVSFKEDQASLPENFIPRSCRVNGGSWILFDSDQFGGEQHVLSEGEYPTLTSMGCLFTTAIHSLKKVPIFFSEPSIFLHGLECFEGKEIELNGEVRSLQAEGFNNHVLSVRVKGGIWVLCEHSDFRGRQWLLDCTEITNWLTYSGLQHIGSLYPIKQRRIYFRIQNAELKSFLSVPDDVEDMKAGRVLVSELNDNSSSIWYYEEGLVKNQVAPNMSLQVIGPAGQGAKVVLWSDTRVPRQTWQVDSFGRICSQMFEDKVLDVKGGRAYDRDHAVLWDSAEERPTQIWDVQVL